MRIISYAKYTCGFCNNFSLFTAERPKQSESVFKINKNTGEITTNAEIDREYESRYELQVLASNNPSLNLSDITVFSNSSVTIYNVSEDSVLKVMVDITDVDDHPPDFEFSTGLNKSIAGESLHAVSTAFAPASSSSFNQGLEL